MSIESVIHEALVIVSIDFKRHNIDIKTEYEKLNCVYIDKSKLTQILINLIRNAKQSVQEAATSYKCILIKTGLIGKNKFFIEVTDNGLGISLKNQTKMFSHGFTTKKSGHGFGLHASAIAAAEMKGSLTATSEGEGKGATFKMIFPYKATELSSEYERECHAKDYAKENFANR